jgi:hypothetical protein
MLLAGQRKRVRPALELAGPEENWDKTSKKRQFNRPSRPHSLNTRLAGLATRPVASERDLPANLCCDYLLVPITACPVAEKWNNM